MSHFILRPYLPSDCAALAALFYETVHTVNAGDYSKEQLDAWADGQVNLEAWNKSFLVHHTYVAVQKSGAAAGGRIIGFGDMDDTGYLDQLYVHKDYLRQGVATAICDRLEGEIKRRPFVTHASITARPFFERRGYVVVKKQRVLRKGVYLNNYIMQNRRTQSLPYKLP